MKNLARENKKTNAFTVAPSPFNAIKLELGIVIVLGGLLLIALDSIIEDTFVQIGVLLLAGLLGMLWIIWRTHAILKHQNDVPPEPTDGKV